MNILRTIVLELVGLFIDDGLFAAAIVVWAALLGLGAPALGVPASRRAVLLFVGLAVILVESVVRRSRSA